MSGASDHSVENITAMVPYISLDPETSKELAPTSREPLVRIGNLVKRSHGIDWALVRLDSNAWYYRNKVRLDHKFGQPDFIYSGDPATEISDDDDIVICTARIGPIKGYISQTPAFIRAAKGGAFQKVWPVVTEQWLGEHSNALEISLDSQCLQRNRRG